MFKCNQCNEEFSFHYKLILHRSSHKTYQNNLKSEICDLCDTLCINADHLKNHVIQHVEHRKFKCGTCGKEFIREKTYVTHVQNHYRQFVCVLCDKVFKCNRNLSEHLRCRTLEIPFKCHICQKVFVRSDKLSAHEKTHKAEVKIRNRDKENSEPTKLRFKCSECEKQYTRKSHLQLHVLSHSSNSAAVCECCGIKFLRNDHLQRHKTTHKCDYETKQCSCLVCGLRFDLEELESHMIKQHNGETPYKCKVCEKSFKKRGNLIFMN